MCSHTNSCLQCLQGCSQSGVRAVGMAFTDSRTLLQSSLHTFPVSRPYLGRRCSNSRTTRPAGSSKQT